MGRREKEKRITICLWVLLIISSIYVFFMLFPNLGKRAVSQAEETLQIAAEKTVSKMLFRGSPVMNYVLDEGISEPKSEETKKDPAFETYERLVYQEVLETSQISETSETEQQVQTSESEPDIELVTVPESEEAEAAAVDSAAVEPAAAPVLTRLNWFENLSLNTGFNLNQMMDYDYLLNHLYVVSAGTSLTPELVNPKEMISRSLAIKKEGEYQILIYHTHSQEAYADSVPGDVSQTVVGMGDLLAEYLEEKGYSVLHHRGIYDMTDGVLDRDPAYTKALPVLSSILEAYPEIQVVIDLHRDGVAEDVHLVTDIEGKQTARIMYFDGMCRDETGELADLKNPNREENMAFTFQLALTTMAEYPGLTRCIYVRSNRYNLHLRGKSALIEVGAQTNTVEEVRNAIPIVADVLDQILKEP